MRIRKASEDGGGTAFADYVWKPVVLIEMKKRGADLSKHYRQAFDYWVRLVPDRPQYVVLCNFDEFWVYDFNNQLDSPKDKVKLTDLATHWGPLAFLFPTREAPRFGNDRQVVTRKAADFLANCFRKLVTRKVDRPTAQRFILQSLVALFAEDIGLLPRYLFGSSFPAPSSCATRAVEKPQRGWTPAELLVNIVRMDGVFRWADGQQRIARGWDAHNDATVYAGDCRELLRAIPRSSAQLVVTSPPYNIGKSYERRTALQKYLQREEEVINACIDALKPGGSICWQVGNHVAAGEIFPLDILLYPFFIKRGLSLRNRIIWHFEHGLHCSKRFSGRYETILWFTKNDKTGAYKFNLDPVRVPQKYPGKKHFKGPRKGEYSANPLGKNPGDVWVIPNVKHNHPEKTIHPCQFPVELVERLVLSMSDQGDLVLDPYMGTGSTLVAAVLQGRRAAGADIKTEYVDVAEDRVREAFAGTVRIRPRSRPVYQPPAGLQLAQRPW